MTVKFRIKETICNKTIEEMDLSVRSFNSCKRAGLNTVADIIDNVDKLRNVSGCGAKCMREILSKIVNMNICYVLGE